MEHIHYLLKFHFFLLFLYVVHVYEREKKKKPSNCIMELITTLDANVIENI